MPGEVASAKDNSSARQDLEFIESETQKLKKDMKILYEDKLAQFIKTEKQLLDVSIRQVSVIIGEQRIAKQRDCYIGVKCIQLNVAFILEE